MAITVSAASSNVGEARRANLGSRPERAVLRYSNAFWRASASVT